MSEPQEPTLFARLVASVVGSLLTHFAIAGILLLWTGSSDRLCRTVDGDWLPCDELALLSAVGGVAIVAGGALGAAEHLVAHGRRGGSRRALLLALLLAPLAAISALHAVALSEGATPAELALSVPPRLTDLDLWIAAAPVAVLWLALGGPLVSARARGQAPRQQSTALALGGLAAFALFLPALRSGASDVFFWRESHNVVLLALFAPAALLPVCLGLGEQAASRLLVALGQAPLAPSGPSPPSLRERWHALVAELRAPAPGRVALTRASALGQEQAHLLRPVAVVLAWTAVSWSLLEHLDLARHWHTAAGAGAPVGGGAIAAIVGRRDGTCPVWRVLIVGSAPFLVALLVFQGANGAALVVSALLVAAAAGRVFPPLVTCLLVTAWPASAAAGWWGFLPFGGRTPWHSYPPSEVLTGLSVLATVSLWLLWRGREAMGRLIGLTAGAALAVWGVHRLARAIYAEDLVLWLFAGDFALPAAGLCGALGYWAGAGPLRRRVVIALIGGVVTLALAQATRGDSIEALPTRRARQRAEAGDPAAMLALARRLEYGVGALLEARRTEEAYVWYQRAAVAGNPEAMLRLALRLEDGRAPRDRDRALRLLREAAALGHPEAQQHLARLAASGRE